MPHTKNFETSSPFLSEAVVLRTLAVLSQSANNATSTESLFRNIARQLLSSQMADAISLLVYDQDAARVTELLLITDTRHFKHTTFYDLPLRGLSLLGTEAAGLTALVEPCIAMAPAVRSRLYKVNEPLHFFTTYSQQLHLPLIDKKTLIGTLTLHGKRPNTYSAQHLSPFVIIANHLSMAMRLYTADLERKRAEEERKRLLALNNALTTVKDKKDLADVMQDQFRSLFPSGDIVICITNQAEQTHSLFFSLPEKGSYLTPSPVASAHYPIDDGFYKQMLTAKNVRLFNIEDLIRQRRVPAYIRYLFDSGIQEIAGVCLRSGHTSIGALFVLCDRHQRLIPSQTISMQAAAIHLSMAITNVLAAERISSHLPTGSCNTPVPTEKSYGMIGSSQAMQRIRQLISQVAASDSTILISGETGTGKELVAKAIHENSTRRHKSMVKVNCAALPATLIESELFGHEKGSFTDAIDQKIGKFEMADKSTLFLDEVGELPLDLQVKLLRVLQEKEIERIGGREVIRTDVRIIAATNRCLWKEMQAGRFRSDLFYRLSVLPVVLPPLRERREDIPALAANFIHKYAHKSGKKINDLSADALQDLMAYHWPGNIRELEHLIERSILLTQSQQITKIDLPSTNGPTKTVEESFRIRTLEEVERDHILAILKKCKGKVAGAGGAANLLNIPSTTLNGKIRRLGIKKDFIAELPKRDG
ncbi:MAG TPA: sigma 54-interacting transcriptional regulator [Puia sp.]|nr:sigma 54-interacting transcriptional regulator [Puia sp.]